MLQRKPMPSSRRRLKRKRTTATAVNGSKVRRERDADSKKEDGSKSRRKPLRVWYPDTSRSCLQGTQQAKQRDGLKQTESNKDHPPSHQRIRLLVLLVQNHFAPTLAFRFRLLFFSAGGAVCIVSILSTIAGSSVVALRSLKLVKVDT